MTSWERQFDLGKCTVYKSIVRLLLDVDCVWQRMGWGFGVVINFSFFLLSNSVVVGAEPIAFKLNFFLFYKNYLFFLSIF